jgi:hypothetical protein
VLKTKCVSYIMWNANGIYLTSKSSSDIFDMVATA